ncbi:hypothetical protein [Bacillus sp. ISL-39]|uniref:hypothetical protein n=1 Tax=Bacillus sp. ISL-39 TaxID=2819124 RepID=UPI001BE7BFE1|nr:hypothetical protein [Bacillus sp. ISL-39]MBT2637955.1 hypothetical protein [Bacillus sp. ISL-39]
MNENDIKPHIDRLKKDPSLNEILNFTQAVLKKSSEKPDEGKVTDHIKADGNNQLNADTLDTLVASAQSFLNPATLSLLSKTLNQSELKKEDSKSSSLKHKVEQLSAEMNEVREELNQTKTQLAEKNKRLEELEETVQYLKRRRRR